MDDKIILYQDENSNVFVDARYGDETFWLTQKAMAELFQVSTQTISRHLQNIYDEEELDKISTCTDFVQVQNEGNRLISRKVLFYNLDAIIAVGYRVNSKQATRFRQWATKTLKEYVIKGFVINRDMLKNGKPFGKDYFDELLEQIREIRASERRFYQKITDIYALSYDYNADAEETRTFFKTVQNKLLFAITGQTAAEMISARADSSKPNMGLETWKHAPHGKIVRTDVTISKNYLNKTEISDLNHIVSMYLDYAENQARRQIPMSMQDWRDRLDKFLDFNEYEILQNAGSISKQIADQLAQSEFEKFRVIQDKTYQSDFDKSTKKLLEKHN